MRIFRDNCEQAGYESLGYRVFRAHVGDISRSSRPGSEKIIL